MDETQRRDYLQKMGIAVWERRDPPHVVEPVEESPVVLQEAPRAGSLSSEVEEWDRGCPAELDSQIPYPDYPSDWEPAADYTAGDDSTSALDWDGLRERVLNCRACGLRQGCTQTVFGVGNEQADLLIIGEAPGADEDRQGEPFVGRAGQLLNEMLLAMGFKREQVFIANILKCRPPDNRDPKPEEALKCEPFLLRQIALIQPRVILSVGRISAQNLLKTDIPVGKLRGRIHSYGEGRIPLVVTYHPAYLLRSPEQKGKSWDDLQLALSLLQEQ